MTKNFCIERQVILLNAYLLAFTAVILGSDLYEQNIVYTSITCIMPANNGIEWLNG